MRILACIALAVAARAGSPACETDRENAAVESALAFTTHKVAVTSITVNLKDYDETDADREDELAAIVEKTLKALAPAGSTISVSWSTGSNHEPVDCKAGSLIPSGATGHKTIHIFDPDFNSECNYNFAGIATVPGANAALIEESSNPLFQHLVIHELGHLLGGSLIVFPNLPSPHTSVAKHHLTKCFAIEGANHATTYSEEYGDPTDALGARRMLRSGASISTLSAGSLAVLNWITLLDSTKTTKVPELGVTNKAVRLTAGLILSYRGAKGHDAALVSKFQRKCYLHTIATDAPGGEHEHSTLLAGPFTTRGAHVGHITVFCTPTTDGALFSVRDGAVGLGYIPDAAPSVLTILLWALLVILAFLFASRM